MLAVEKAAAPKASDSMFLRFCVQAPVWFHTNYYFGTWREKKGDRNSSGGLRGVLGVEEMKEENKKMEQKFFVLKRTRERSYPRACSPCPAVVFCFPFDTNYPRSIYIIHCVVRRSHIFCAANLSTGQKCALPFLSVFCLWEVLFFCPNVWHLCDSFTKLLHQRNLKRIEYHRFRWGLHNIPFKPIFTMCTWEAFDATSGKRFQTF